MLNFEFGNPTRIIFGRGTHREVGQQVKKYAKKVLLHYGGKSIKASGVYDAVIASLKEAGVEYTELGGVQPNPRLKLVYEGDALCKEQGIDFILAVGGGSVIDSAKAIAVGACYNGDVWDFYSNIAKPSGALNIGVVLTIPAAGSESSDGSVITKEEGAYKRSCCTDFMYPRFAVLNPELCYTLPHNQIAAGGADILAHIMERYFTNTTHTDFSDRLCEGAMRSVMENLLKVKQDTQNYDAWAEVMWGGTVAHNGLLGKGRQEDWASHGIEHELSGIYDIAHGAGLAILFPAWMKYVHKTNLNRFVQFAVRVFDVDMAFENLEEIALEGIRRLERFFTSLGLAVTLSQAGIGSKDFAEMARKACENGPLGSFNRLEPPDVEQIFKLAE